ncbi:MAG: hypothetical protein IKQ31_05815 [Clostridia bacterium]|nr:hypothetical protein [Clostridia bacterium]
MKEKNRLTIFAILELIVAVLGIVALCRYCWGIAYNAFRHPASLLEENTLSKFTNLSNIFVSVVGLIGATYAIMSLKKGENVIPRWVATMKFMSVVYIVITFVVVSVLLSWISPEPWTLFSGKQIFTHITNPIIAVIGYCFLSVKEAPRPNIMWLSLIPVALYSALYVVMVFVVKTWSDFYGVGIEMPWSMVVYGFALVGFSVAISFILYKLKFRKMVAKTAIV